ncbi:MAG: hypothetical protein M3Y08_18980, partial [Fibrobacterota bacterium]|nr:hypothetical protein [Fibrobacterota bacterium]
MNPIRLPRLAAPLGLAAALAATLGAQTLTAPMAVFKDGQATSTAQSGTAATLAVNGSATPSVAWTTFQTAGIDRATVIKAVLALNVRGVTTAGTLRVHALTAAVTAPEASVPLASIPYNPAVVIASAPLAAADVGKVIQLDITAAVKSGTFNGVALSSNTGLVAT